MTKHTERLELTDIDKLIPYANNARTHSEDQIKKIQASIREFGFVNPVLIDKNYGIIAGHGRVVAARREGINKVPCVWVEHLTEAQKRAYILADNRLALDAGWDMEILKVEMEQLQELDFDIELTGFDADEIEDITAQTFQPQDGLTPDDAIPEEVETICKKGDLWRLGNHRLLCGDSTVITDVERLMDGQKADLILTDPPYGINIVKVKNDGGCAAIGASKPFGSTSPERQLSTKKGRVVFTKICEANLYAPIIGDDKPFDPSFLLTLSKNQIIFGANYFASKLPDGKAWIVWDKDVHGNFSEVELAWTSFEGKLRLYKYIWSGLRREGNRKDELTKRVHPTQKPVGLFVAILQDYEGQKVLDCYGGSGTTLIACEKLNRKCYMMEIDPHYCDVIITRWQDFTGKKAELLGSE